MKILVTGAAGQLGHDLLREAGRRGHQAIGTDLGDRWTGLQMDITGAEAVSRTIHEINKRLSSDSCPILDGWGFIKLKLRFKVLKSECFSTIDKVNEYLVWTV